MNDRDEAHAGLLVGGRYRLITPIGAGGMAVVWRAHDELLGRVVAVKMLAAKHLGDNESRGRIRHEARAAAALAHPNVAQVHDYGEMVTEEGTFPYVVMELVPGGTLLDRLRDGPLAVRDAMRICSEIAAGLDAAHAEGLVHRDVKPANVMLAPTGAKVVDFGIAAAVSPGRPQHEDFIVYGTPAYLAPERLIDDVVVPASDVYSVGILLYRLLAGRLPWDQEQTTRMLVAHVYLAPAPLPQIQGVPEYAARLCHRCLAKDPGSRPPAREVAEVLARAAAEPPEPPRNSSAGNPREASNAGRKPLRWTVVGIAVAAAVAAIGWAVTLGDRGERGVNRALPFRSATGTPTPSLIASTPAPKVVTKVVTEPAIPGAETTAPSRSSPPSEASPETSAPATVGPPGPAGPPTPARPPARPVERTFSSEAGSVRATCPAPGTAQILATSPTKPFKVDASEPGPSSAAFVTFQRGSERLTMTVTCDGSQPSVTRVTS